MSVREGAPDTQPHAKVETLQLIASDVREWKHRVEMTDDGRSDDEPILFRWHFPRGTLDRHMSALELTIFLLPHMEHIAPFLLKWPKAYQEWVIMLHRLVNTPAAILDDLVPWMRIRLADEADSIVELSLSIYLVQESMGTSFIIHRK